MKFARFRVDGYDYYGQVEGDRLRAIQGDLFSGDCRVTGAVYPLDRVKLLPPSRPVNFWGLGENYPVHVQFRVEQMGNEIAERARRFSPWHKSVGALIASGDTVVMPPDLKVLEYEGELCIVIGRPACRVSREDARHYIFGYTVSNGISGADYRDAFMWRMKCSDTFGPVGPWIETEIEPHSLDIITRVDGRQEDVGNTRDMVGIPSRGPSSAAPAQVRIVAEDDLRHALARMQVDVTGPTGGPWSCWGRRWAISPRHPGPGRRGGVERVRRPYLRPITALDETSAADIQ